MQNSTLVAFFIQHNRIYTMQEILQVDPKYFEPVS